MVRKFYAYLIVSQMVQEQVYVMLRFRKFSTHFVICAYYQDQQCDSGLSKGRGWSRVDFRRLKNLLSLRKSTRFHPLPLRLICKVACRTEATVEFQKRNIRGRKPECFETIGIVKCEKKTVFFGRKVLGCVRFVVDGCKHATLGISTINNGHCIFQT